jgi:hypothetical protein
MFLKMQKMCLRIFFYGITLDEGIKIDRYFYNKPDDKGKPAERQGRKALGLNPDFRARPPGCRLRFFYLPGISSFLSLEKDLVSSE